MLTTVQRNEQGGKKEEQKWLEHKKEKKKKTTRRVSSVEVWGESAAGQGWGRGGKGEWEWSKAARHHISLIFFSNHSLHHTTRHCFFQSGTCRATRSCEIDHWTAVSCYDRPAEGGRLARLSRGYSSPTEGTGRESRLSTRITCFGGGKYNIDTSALCFMRGSCVNKWLQTSPSIYMQATCTQWFNDLRIDKNEAWSLQTS